LDSFGYRLRGVEDARGVGAQVDDFEQSAAEALTGGLRIIGMDLAGDRRPKGHEPGIHHGFGAGNLKELLRRYPDRDHQQSEASDALGGAGRPFRLAPPVRLRGDSVGLVEPEVGGQRLGCSRLLGLGAKGLGQTGLEQRRVFARPGGMPGVRM
jgi:hypothetical protein